MYLLRSEVEKRKNPASGEPAGFFTRIHHRFEHGFEAFRKKYANLLALCLEHQRVFAVCFLIFCIASLALVPVLGQDFFPSVDAGQIRLHTRAKTGTRIEDTASLNDQIERVIRQQIPAPELAGILDNIGLPTSGINLSYSNSGTIGKADAEILISLQAKHHPTAQYVERLREELPKAFPGTSFFFEPADIVSQILNFGLPSPIDIQIAGPNLADNFAVATRIANEIRSVPGAVDVHIQQALDQPRLQYTVDRTQNAASGAHRTRRRQQPSRFAELQLPNHPQFLAEREERGGLQHWPFKHRSTRSIQLTRWGASPSTPVIKRRRNCLRIWLR